MTANRTYIALGMVVGFVALAVLWSLFRPELLFVNATVNEALPAAVVSAPPAASSNDETVAQPTAAAMSNSETVAQATAPSAMADVAPTEAPPSVVVSAPPTVSSNNETIAQPTAAAMSNGETAAQATAPAAMADAAPTAVAAQPTTWSATFQGLAHETKGTANVRVLEDGSRVLRLEDFTTSNGPDVRVYLVRGGDGTQDEAINRGDFVDLGALKGNIGNQNYTIPADLDLSQYQSVSIWCRRFSVNFGATMLN